jgi:hypothetical protein
VGQCFRAIHSNGFLWPKKPHENNQQKGREGHSVKLSRQAIACLLLGFGPALGLDHHWICLLAPFLSIFAFYY